MTYEEIVHNQMLSLLDDIEEKIGTILLKAVFDDGHEADLVDLQIYPSTEKSVIQGAAGSSQGYSVLAFPLATRGF